MKEVKTSNEIVFEVVAPTTKALFSIIGAGKAVNKSAASAASPDSAKFQAVIKLAASAASLH